MNEVSGSGVDAKKLDHRRVWKVPKEAELRLESKGGPVYVTLLGRPEGSTAEVFGTELPPRVKMELYRGKGAVFSWTGCEIEVEGQCHAYVAEETPMLSYLNVHTALEARRVKARGEKGYGPKVVVCGGADVGKSTLCRILLSYGARMGSVPVFVDLDVGQNAVTVPGALAAVHVGNPVDVEVGMSRLSPLAYFFGHTTPSKNIPLYKKQVEALAGEISKHLATKEESRASGIIVNTCGWVEKEGYELLLDTIKAFKADIVLVIDNERLHTDLRDKEFVTSKIEFIKLKKSGGVLSRDRDARAAARQQAIREYFYGARNELHPHHMVILSNVIRTCTVGGEAQAPSTALPVGAERVLDVTEVNQVEPSDEMKHKLGAISFSDVVGESLSYNLCGFVQITDVEADRLHLLSPCPGRLPSTVLLVSDINCLDTLSGVE